MNETSVNNAKTKPDSGIIGFQKEIADIQTAIAGFEMGGKQNIAIIGEPYGGRTALINEIERMNPDRITKLNFSSVVKNKEELVLPENSKRVVILDHCDFLYTRNIGGFDVLEEAFELLISPGNLFITTWNLFSWNYLDEVVKISKFFPVRIYLPKLTAPELKKCILSRYDDSEIKFIEDVAFEKEKLIEFVKYPLTLKPFKNPINFPFFKINWIILDIKLWHKEEKITVEDLIFDKIHHISKGNQGVAKVLWDKSLEYPAIKPSRIKKFSFNIDLDFNEAFILGIILSKKSIEKDELVEIAVPEFRINEIIFRLEEQELIQVNDGYCTIKPEALHSIVDYLEKSRLVW